MKTNKITPATNNFNITRTKQSKKVNNRANLSFKAIMPYAKPKTHHVVQSIWHKFFPKFQHGMVKKVYNGLTPTSVNSYTADEVKYYYKKNDDKLLLKIFQDCTLDKEKNIKKASKIFYQYDFDKSDGLKQKVIINPEFDQNGEFKKAEFIHEYYENNPNKKQMMIHYNVNFKNGSMVSSQTSEAIYSNNTTTTYTNTSINKNGEISSFEKKEHVVVFQEGNKNLKEKTIWLNNNDDLTKPDFYSIEEKENGMFVRKTYLEKPVFRDDNSVQSAKRSLDIIENKISCTDYKPQFDEDGVLKESELHRMTELDADIEQINDKSKKYQQAIDKMYQKDKEEFAKKMELRERQKKLEDESFKLNRLYKYLIRFEHTKETSVETLFQKTSSPTTKALLTLYRSKLESAQAKDTTKKTFERSSSSTIKSLRNVYENKSDKCEEEKISPKMVLELIEDINKEKESLQPEIDAIEKRRSEIRKEIDVVRSEKNKLNLSDRIYRNYRPGGNITPSSSSFYAKIIEEYLNFEHKELFDNE